MAFALTATCGSTTINLSNRAPFAFRTLRGGGGVGIRRITVQGPAQDGDTDRGYRLGARDLELVVVFTATSDAVLDGYRDTLTQFFKPLTSVPVELTMTLDNGNVRQVDVFPRGDIPVKISLTPELRPSHTHQATISLRAPEPAWYNPTQGSVSVVGTSLVASQWYYAGGAIGSAQVAEFGTVPTQGQVWTYTGTPTAAQGYTIAFRSGRETITDGKFAFFAGAGGGSPSMTFRTQGTTDYVFGSNHEGGYQPWGGSVMAAGTHNYFISAYVYFNGAHEAALYRDTGLSDYLAGDGNDNFTLGGTARRWRSDATNSVGSRWTEALHKYAVYVPQLEQNQIDALSVLMDLPADQTNAQTLPISYAGNLPEYPIISIRGPVTNPSVTNLTTGDTLDFGTIIIGAGTTYVINTHPQYRTVYAGTVNKRRELTPDSDLDRFHLSPATADGVNVLYLNGTAMGTATQFSVTWYERYSSF